MDQNLHLYISKKSELFDYQKALIAKGSNNSHSKNTKKTQSDKKITA